VTSNILFIMCDQLRHDYLGCSGHPHIRTPNIDALAADGVRFDRAFVQSPICGPSRMSFYTGRYVRSHGSTWNMAPLRVGELNIGDHLNPLGMRTVLCGKTHMAADFEGMERLGINPGSEIGARVAQCGFEVWDRLDGIHPSGGKKKPSHYNAYLNDRGYPGADPWETAANSVESDEGEALSGWFMANVDKPALVSAEESETAYTTTRAIEFIDQADDRPWCLHLSYIKPHWPYVAPAPYHAMYTAADVIPPVRDPVELENPHPVLGAFHKHRVSRVYAREGVRERVIPAYMGLITQIDDEIGRLIAWLKETGRYDDTVIVFTSDHGDYLGDHWLGEKELFHDASLRIPLIVRDPSAQADATRGTVSDALVEAIDLLPTFVEMAGGQVPGHILEGQSLLPLLHGQGSEWAREAVFSEYDYAYRLARQLLDREIADCRLQMVFDGRWKMIRAPGFRPMLYDLQIDPDEFHDLGADPASRAVIDRLMAQLLEWATRHHAKQTQPDTLVEAISGTEFHVGILIGFWDEADLEEARDKGHGGN
jgi:arylsulfatase A-like enzyme